MAMKWMMGTAAAALIAASPAFAQSGTGVGNCLLNEMTNEEFLGLDLNNDSGLTMDEYRECLAEADLSDDERAEYEAAFSEADADADAILVVTEVETYRTAQQASAGEIGEDGQPQGTITVTQPAADVDIAQPSPDVTVTQQAPDVTVQPRAPEVAVTTPEPEVDVTQPDVEVAVTQPAPDVSVTQPEPQVSVSQPDPEVSVQAGQPAVAVDTAAPEVAVATPEPEVVVEQPELDVNVDQADPDVAVRQAQPDVAVRQSGSADVATETAAVDAAIETDATAGAAYRVAVDELVGRDVYNAAGEEIGQVEEVVLDPSLQSPVVIVKVGGFLGLGGREIALPYDDLTVGGDRVVMNSDMGQDEIDTLPDYDETAYQPLPDTMIVR